MLSFQIDTNSDEPLYEQISPFEVDISHFPYSVWKRLSKQILTSHCAEPYANIYASQEKYHVHLGYSNLSEEDIKTGLAKLISICNYLESQATGHL